MSSTSSKCSSRKGFFSCNVIPEAKKSLTRVLRSWIESRERCVVVRVWCANSPPVWGLSNYMQIRQVWSPCTVKLCRNGSSWKIKMRGLMWSTIWESLSPTCRPHGMHLCAVAFDPCFDVMRASEKDSPFQPIGVSSSLKQYNTNRPQCWNHAIHEKPTCSDIGDT